MLKQLAPPVRTLDTRTVRSPIKVKDPIYNTPEFMAWRAAVIERAGHRCQAVDQRGMRRTKARPDHRMYADHIIELRDGGAVLDLSNGQCLSHHTLKTVAARARRLRG